MHRSKMDLTIPPHYYILLALLYKNVAANPEFTAVSSEISLCGFSCIEDVFYDLIKEPEEHLVYVSCNTWMQQRFRKGIDVNSSTGCCKIKNVQKSDSGVYDLLATKESGHRVNVLHKECRVIDRIRNVTITPETLGENISLSVHYEGDSPTHIIWSKNGELWPEGHFLSDDNSTLTLPGSAAGIYTATVMNPVSNMSVEYTIQYTEKATNHQDLPTIYIVVFLAVAAVVGCVIWLRKRYKKRGENVVI
ncbi:vascular endothelial growth factor receptor 2-like [Lithobates pipiens]